MDTFMTLILPAFTVIIVAYGTDILSLLHWLMQSKFEKEPAETSPEFQQPSKATSDRRIKKDNSQFAIERIISDFSSTDKRKRLSARELIIKFPPHLLEEKFLPLISDTGTDFKIATSAAEILIENGREEIIPYLASFFSHREKGIAGFLADRDYNKVVNLFK